MQRIEYRATYGDSTGSHQEVFTVSARNINSGFPKAVKLALRGMPKGWELLTVEFWQVL